MSLPVRKSRKSIYDPGMFAAGKMREPVALPPSIHAIGATPDYWFCHLEHNRFRLTIQKPEFDYDRRGYMRESGRLLCTPNPSRVENLRFGQWNLSTSYLKLRGWVLVMRFSGASGERLIPIGFWAHSKGRDLPVWVNDVNKRLSQTLGRLSDQKPAP